MITPKKLKDNLTGELYCLVPYFNPLGFSVKFDNFCVFYQQLMKQGIKNIIVVEGALHDRAFQLDSIVSEKHLVSQVVAEDVIWQKEALLNIALRHLPSDCDKVCWLDADILYPKEEWFNNIALSLNNYNLVQGFSFCGFLQKGIEFVDLIDMNSFSTRYETGCKMYGFYCGLMHNKIQKGDGITGISWAARRSVIEECGGFYDECITGGGDSMIAMSSIFQHYNTDFMQHYSRFQLDSYYAWTKKFTELVDFSVAYVSNTVYHLFHGRPEYRRYIERLQPLKTFDYDPRLDIIRNENGTLAFTDSGKELFRETLIHYIANRNEQ